MNPEIDRDSAALNPYFQSFLRRYHGGRSMPRDQWQPASGSFHEIRVAHLTTAMKSLSTEERDGEGEKRSED